MPAKACVSGGGGGEKIALLPGENPSVKSTAMRIIDIMPELMRGRK